MPISFELGTDYTFDHRDREVIKREGKGKSIVSFPNDFCVLDLETTGLSPLDDEIIEVAILKIRNGEVTDSFESLVKPGVKLDDFIVRLTGLTDEMLVTAPRFKEIASTVTEFLGDDIIVGHNISFDVNFLFDKLKQNTSDTLSNDYIDTRRIARKALPLLPNYKLRKVADALKVCSRGYHRALNDCYTTYDIYIALRDVVAQNGTEEFLKSFKKRHKEGINLRTVTAETIDFDETHPLYGKHCVFTGTLEKMSRVDAAQIVVNLGGICDNNVTKHTNFLILGNNDYCKTIKDGKSAKHKKAENYKLNGVDIEIMPESVFYDMIEE